jgi:hypothetical protein
MEGYGKKNSARGEMLKATKPGKISFLYIAA